MSVWCRGRVRVGGQRVRAHARVGGGFESRRLTCGPPGPATRDPPRHGEENRTSLAVWGGTQPSTCDQQRQRRDGEIGGGLAAVAAAPTTAPRTPLAIFRSRATAASLVMSSRRPSASSCICFPVQTGIDVGAPRDAGRSCMHHERLILPLTSPEARAPNICAGSVQRGWS